jgi:uncharacterized protein
MIRVVIDTNILVSALLLPQSLPAVVVMLAVTGEVQLCMSDAIFAEYDEVIRRPHLKLPIEVVRGTLLSIRKVGVWVPTDVRAAGCSDLDDNIFLECAEAAAADYLVTGNQRHFPDRWKKTRVISARAFVEIIMEKKK